MDAHEALARTAAAFGADRVELYAVDRLQVRLIELWTPLAAGLDDRPRPRAVPLAWFPWSLGNIRPEEYLFVRNAAPLPGPGDDGHTVGDLGMSSCVHVPVLRGAGTVGSLCAYWASPRSSWDDRSREAACSWALEALARRR